MVARLKGNLPDLSQAAQKRFSGQAPKLRFRFANDGVEVWDASDFDPWETLRWPTVRVLYYRQHKPDGSLIEAYWLTNLSHERVSRTRFVLHGEKPLGDRKSGLQCSQEPAPAGTYLSSPRQQHIAVAAQRLGSYHRAALPAALLCIVDLILGSAPSNSAACYG